MCVCISVCGLWSLSSCFSHFSSALCLPGLLGLCKHCMLVYRTHCVCWTLNPNICVLDIESKHKTQYDNCLGTHIFMRMIFERSTNKANDGLNVNVFEICFVLTHFMLSFCFMMQHCMKCFRAVKLFSFSFTLLTTLCNWKFHFFFFHFFFNNIKYFSGKQPYFTLLYGVWCVVCSSIQCVIQKENFGIGWPNMMIGFNKFT